MRNPSSFFAKVLQKCSEESWLAAGTVAGDTVDFGCKIWGGETNPSSMMIRGCFETYKAYVKELVASPGHSVILAGSKGIGKSFFGLYLCVDVLKSGWIVLYEYCGRRSLLVPLNVSAEHLRELNAELLKYERLGVQAGNAYEFLPEDRGVFEALAALESLYYIVDIGEDTDQAHVLLTGNPRRVVITSPNSDKIKRLGVGTGVAKTLFMPSWGWGEIETMNECPFMVNQPATSFVGPKPAAELKRLFDLYGGVPRHLFARDPVDTMERAVSKVNLDVLRDMFTTGKYQDLPTLKDGMGCLMRIEPMTHVDSKLPRTIENARKGKAVVASPKVLDMLRDSFVSKSRDDNFKFFNAVKGIVAFSSFRGYFMDEAAHAALVQKRDVYLECLDTRKEGDNVTWPALNTKTFSHEKMLDLASLAKMDYARPTFFNFPSIDSFAVVPESIFVPGRHKECLVLFQVTVADHHVIRGPDLEHVQERATLLLGKKVPVYLVFVTTNDGVRAKQTIKTGKDEDYIKVPDFIKKLSQYALLLGSEFDAAADGWKGAVDVEQG